MNGSQEHLTPIAHAAHNCCFGCGAANATGLHLEFLLADDGSVVSLPCGRGILSMATPDICTAASSPRCSTRP